MQAIEFIDRESVHPRHRITRTIQEPYVWRGQNGVRHNVTSMTIKHIKSCLALCLRKNYRMEYVPKFEEEIRLREPLLHIRVDRNPVATNEPGFVFDQGRRVTTTRNFDNDIDF